MSNAVAAALPRTLAEFAAAPDELLAHLKASGKARRLQVGDGRTVLVVDEDVYRKLREAEEHALLLESVLETDADPGSVVDAREFLLSLGKEKP